MDDQQIPQQQNPLEGTPYDRRAQANPPQQVVQPQVSSQPQQVSPQQPVSQPQPAPANPPKDDYFSLEGYRATLMSLSPEVRAAQPRPGPGSPEGTQQVYDEAIRAGGVPVQSPAALMPPQQPPAPLPPAV